MSRSMWVSGCSFNKDEHKYFPQCHLSRVACSPPPIPPLAHKKPPVPYPSFSRLVHLPQLTTSCLHLWGFIHNYFKHCFDVTNFSSFSCFLIPLNLSSLHVFKIDLLNFCELAKIRICKCK